MKTQGFKFHTMSVALGLGLCVDTDSSGLETHLIGALKHNFVAP